MTDVLMRTSAGDITIELFDDKAPKTVENFLKLVDKKFYNGLHNLRLVRSYHTSVQESDNSFNISKGHRYYYYFEQGLDADF